MEEDKAITTPTRTSNTYRDQRLKKLEGPADNASTLAEKLSFFTYYELLYLDDNACSEDIDFAYIKRVSDIRARFRAGSITEEWRLTEFIRVLHRAHTVLSSTKLRRDYDAHLSAGDWTGNFQDLLSRHSEPSRQSFEEGGTTGEVALTDLLLCAGFLSPSALDNCDPNATQADVGQRLADDGLISFNALAEVMLAKALIDRRLLSKAQFVQAVATMRNHSAPFIDAVVSEGWLTASELSLMGIS